MLGQECACERVMFEDLLVVDQGGLADLGGKFHAAEWRGGDTQEVNTAETVLTPKPSESTARATVFDHKGGFGSRAVDGFTDRKQDNSVRESRGAGKAASTTPRYRKLGTTGEEFSAYPCGPTCRRLFKPRQSSNWCALES
jgi:hypothetical protein